MNRKRLIYLAVFFSAIAAAGGVCLFAGIADVPQPALAGAGMMLAAVLIAGLWMVWRLKTDIERFCSDIREKRIGGFQAGSLFEQVESALRETIESVQRQLKQSSEENRELGLQLQLQMRKKNSVEAILYSIRDAVLVTDGQDRLILTNQAAQERLELISAEPGRPVEEILNNKELISMIQKTRQSRVRHVRHELTLKSREQTLIFDCVFSCVTDDHGQVTAVIAVLHDITREKEIARMKNDFVSHVSHELKTPLASINAYAEMLVDGEAQDAGTVRQFCGIIQGQAQRLNRLIEDILNISRIESGMVKVNRDNHSLALVIRDAVEMIKSYAQEKNIEVKQPAAILFDQVSIDKDMMNQVVINLLSNAVKYTPSGGTITVNSQVNQADGTITVSVTDTGVGIPDEDLGKLFEKFYRVAANNQYAKGTGLGLNLVKQIVETVHGGKVFVTSRQGQGSTFGFVLPLAGAMAVQNA